MSSRRIRRRKTIARHVERLDLRVVLSASSATTYDTVAPQWFDVSAGSPDSAIEVPSDETASEWIIRLTPEALQQVTAVEESGRLLNVGPLSFHVQQGLGLPGLFVADVTGGTQDDVAAALAANPDVAYFEHNSDVFATAIPNDTRFSQQTELQRIGATAAWDTQTGSSSQVIAVIDSGIDYTSPDLYLNIWLNQGEIPAGLSHSPIDTDSDGRITFWDLNQSANLDLTTDFNQNGYRDAGDLLVDPAWMDHVDGERDSAGIVVGDGKADDLIGWDFTDNDAAPFDGNGHGTHVSGILAATGNNGTGIAGVNWGAQIMVVKFLDQRLHGELTDAVSALNYVTQFRQSRLNGITTAPDVRISNNSWEIRTSQTVSAQSLNDAIVANANSGMLLIAAAGNGVGEVPQNLDTDPSASLPAANPSLNVISVAAVDSADNLLFNSNYGATTVDLAAPGLDILSTEPGGNYRTRTGTSMATPFVSGAAALFWAHFPDATAAEVRLALLNGVDQVPGLAGKVATGGRLNLEKTLNFDALAPRATLTSAPNITSTGSSFEDVTVRYTDNVAVNWSTLGNGDILVTRADGQTFTATITLQSTSVSTNAPLINATYRVFAPNTKWTNADNGIYEIRWVADQVADVVANKNRAGLLGTFQINIPAPDDMRVTSLVDSVDQFIGDSRIEDSQGRATLRAAIQEANFDPDANTIKLIAGTYTFTIGGSGENAAATGDLDLVHNVTIIGDSTTSTIIDAAQLDRVFHVLPGVTLTLKNLTIRGGRANDGVGGGGILNQGTLILDHVVVTGNTAVSGGGGGVLNNNTAAASGVTTLDVRDSTFSNNLATAADGGGVKIQKGDALLQSSTWSTNTAGTSGGGLSVLASLVTVKNATFSANTAGTVGGGLQLTGGGLSLTNTTITLNAANTAGGGLGRSAPSTMLMVNTIAAQNVLTGLGTDVDVSGAINPTGSGSNFIGIVGTATGFSGNATNQIGTAANPLNAQLASLADYGGATWTHRPNVGSPVIDRGAAVSGLTTDQRGLTRIIDGDNSGTATTDIGAVEFVLFSTISGTVYDDLNQNGVYDPNEQALAGWTVYLDTNFNQLLDAGERSLVTGADGRYSFSNVLPGNYSVAEILQQSSIQGTIPATTQVIDNFDSLTPYTNSPPISTPQSVFTNVNVVKTLTLTGDDGDLDSVQTLTFAIVTAPAHGTLSGFNPQTGIVTYVPNQDYIGSDSFQFSVTDDSSAGGPALTSGNALISINIYASDHGDAPDTGPGTSIGNYQTLMADNGPSHTLTTTQTTLFLGARVDGNPNGVPNLKANGDDTSPLPDDEDGLLEPAQDLLLTVGSIPQVRVRATNTTGSAATLYGWIDYNRDGVFDNATERTSALVPTATSNATFILTFPVVPLNTAAGPTYARFRLSSDVAAANATGPAVGGEVEDYPATITQRGVGNADPTKTVKQGNSLNGGPAITNYDYFGRAIASLGDLDGDGVVDVAVGNPRDDTGGLNRGAVYVQFLNSNGSVKSNVKIASSLNGGPNLLDGGNFGTAISAIGDLDGDGVNDLAVGAPFDNTGGSRRGAAYVLLLNANGTVKTSVTIASSVNGGPAFGDDQFFGGSVAPLGDLDGDGVVDMAVGRGVFGGGVYVLLLNSSGTVKSSVQIASGTNGGPALTFNDQFGYSMATMGDLNGDGVTDLAVGAKNTGSTGSAGPGAVYALMLNANGTVKSSTIIASGINGGPSLLQGDYFGLALASVGDIDGDGVTDLAVANRDKVTANARGAVYLLLMNSNGTVKSNTKIGDSTNGGPVLPNNYSFGAAIASVGDLDGDGVAELAVGGYGHGGLVYVMFMNSTTVPVVDYGDAPDTGSGTGTGNYQTNRADVGPSHTIGTTQSTLFLGTGVDGEIIPTTNSGATGDDVAGGADDENGVFEPQQDLILEIGTTPKVRVRATNTTGAAATIYGWIDYNRDGVFDNATERASAVVTTGSINNTFTLTFPTIPLGVTPGTTYARFRLSSDSAAANATGMAVGGEVEDYAASLIRTSDLTANSSKTKALSDGINGTPALGSKSYFGSAVASLGDLDGDGVTDLAVGARADRVGSPHFGAVFIQFMNSNGTVKSSTKIGNLINGGPALSDYGYFGKSIVALGDINGDGVNDLAVGADHDSTSGVANLGAVYVLMLNSNGTVKSNVKIAKDVNGGPANASGFGFGSSLASLGDRDGDGVTDLAVGAARDSTGATENGAIYELLMNSNGTVKSSLQIASGVNGGPVLNSGQFGGSVASVGDLDGDGLTDIVVGAYRDGDRSGAVYTLFLNANGTVKNSTKLANNLNGAPRFVNADYFGYSLASLGDLDGDGVTDLAAGAAASSVDGGIRPGVVFMLLMNANGTVKSYKNIGNNTNGGPGLDTSVRFGTSVASLGDLDGDGVIDLAVGAWRFGAGDDLGHGAAYVLFLNAQNANSPIVTSSATPTVLENSTGVLTVLATDADLPAQTLVRTLTGGADQDKFTITPGGVLTFKVAPNFENPSDANTDNVYEVQVTVDDGAGRVTVQSLSITVADMNEAPATLTLSATSLAGNNVPHATVGSLSATDPDSGNAFTYSLVAGPGSTDNSSFVLVGNILTITPVANAAVQSSYSIRVRATDQAGLTLEQPFTIAVLPAGTGIAPGVPDVPAGWAITGTVPWITVTGGSSSASNHAFLFDSAFTSDSALTSAILTVTQQNLQFAFQNRYDTEFGHDGGVLEVALNGGNFTDIIAAGGSFAAGGYNSTITTGRMGWTGNSGGYIATLVTLPDYGIGSTLQFRWRFLSDATGGGSGWSIDTVQLSGKQPPWTLIAPSQAAPAPGRYSVGVDPGTTHSDLNFGNAAQTALIRGQLFIDFNQDGLLGGAAETLLPGWTVFLDQNANHSLDAGELSTVTASDGTYSFVNIPALVPQNVTALLPVGWETTVFPAGLVVSGQTLQRSVTLDAAEQRSNLNFAVHPQLGELRGSLFNDRDRDGVRDDGEEGVAGITLFLDISPQNASQDPGEPRAVTDAAGNYVFLNLDAYTSLAVQSKTYRIIELVDFSRSQLVQSLPARQLAGVDVSPFMIDAKFRTGFDISVDGAGGFLLTGTDGAGNGFNQQDVFHVTPDGRTVSYLAAADHPQGVASDGTYAYWVDLNGELNQTRIYRQLLVGGARELIASYLTPGLAASTLVGATGLDLVPGAPGSLVTVDSFQGQLSQLTALPGITADQIAAIGGARFPGQLGRSHAQFLAVDNGVVYVADPGYVADGSDHSQDLPARILSIPLAGGAYSTLYSGNLPSYNFFGALVVGSAPRGIAVQGSTIYVTGDQGIYSLPITGGTPTPVAADERFQQLAQLTWSQGSLYVIDNGTSGAATVWQVNLHPTYSRTVSVDTDTEARSWDVVLTPGADVSGLDFARYDGTAAIGASGSQSIHGSVFNDVNGNGLKDPGETGLPGVTVFLDLNRTGVLDEGDLTTVTLSGDDPNTPATESAGEYVFTDREPGLYEVLLADPALGLDLTSGRRVALTPSELDPTNSYGVPRAIAIGDWSHDGLDDLVVVDSETGLVAFWQNTGNQHFTKSSEFFADGVPTSVALLDMDGDTWLDVVIGRAQFGSLGFWKNNKNGTFSQQMTGGVGTFLALGTAGNYGIAGTIVAADFNNDSRLDLAVVDVHPEQHRVFVFRRRAGAFDFAAPQILDTGLPAKGLIVANLNSADQTPDLATVVPGSDQLRVWLNANNVNGTMNSTPLITAVGHGPTALAVVQANGDAYPDLAIANTLGGTVTILGNSGAASWTTLSTLALTVPPTNVLAANLDGRNGPDLAVTLGDGTDSAQPLAVFFHTGDNLSPYAQSDAYGAGIFDTSPLKTATGLALAAANLDQDQNPDLILVNGAAKSVSVLRNAPSTGGQTVRLIPGGIGGGSAFGINFGIQNRHTATWNPATGTLTVNLLAATELEIGAVGTQLQLRVQGVVDASINVAVADVRAIVVEGSSGADRIDLSGVGPATGFSHAGGVAVTLNGNGGNDTLNGSDFNDQLNGGEGNNVLSGGNGNDNLIAGTGDDLLFGGAGDDILNGQGGANVLDGGSGNNTLLGGLANAAPVFTGGTGIPVVLNAGAQSIPGWATAISAGSASESSQVLNFLVDNDNNSLFSVQPVVSANGTLTFTPATNVQGSALVTVRLHDNGGTANGGIDTSGPQTFTITVTGVNAPPTANPQSATTSEGTAKVLTLSGTDGDAAVVQTLTYAILNGPAHGTLGVLNTATGQVTYTPSADYNGPDSFTFTVTDDATAGGPAKTSPAATVTMTVTPVNGTPTATPQSASTASGVARALTLTGTDGDPEVAQSLTYAILNGPTHGTLGTLNTATGEVTYTPNPGYSGPDNFTFTVTDDGTAGGSAETSAAASVTLTVTAVAPPTVTLSLGTTSIAEATGATQLTATLSQITNVPVTVNLAFSGSATEQVDYAHSATQIVIPAGSSSAVITLTATQDPLFEGNESAVIDISAVTNAVESGTQQVTLQIVDDDHAPVFTSAAASSVPEGTTDALILTATDADSPAQTLTFTLTGGADQARFTLTGNSLSFSVPPNFASPADANTDNVYEVRITVSDGQGGVAVQNLTVTVTPVNAMPTANPQSVSTPESTATLLTLSGTDGDPEVVQSLTYAILNGPAHGTLGVLNAATGQVTYTPSADYNGPDSFTFTVTDDATAGGPAKTSPAATVTLTVTPVNGTPTASPQSASTAAGVAKILTLTGTDGDPEVAQSLTYAILNGPTHGTLGTLNTATGEVTYTPNPGYTGPDNFTFTVTDDGTAGGPAKTSTAASVTLTVTAVVLPTVTLSLGTANIAEASGSTQLTATLSQVTNAPVTVTLSFTGSATESVDYSHSATQIVIAAGSTTGSITLTATQDPLFEGNQSVIIDISSVTNADENGTQQVTLQITDDDHAPAFTSAASVSVAENTTAVLQLTATDADLPAQTLTFTLTGGADQARFTLSGSSLSFSTPPSFASPTDANGDNIYEVQITVNDGQGGVAVHNLSVTVTPVNATPTANPQSVSTPEGTATLLTLSGTDGDPEVVQTLTYAILNGPTHGTLGVLNAATGQVTYTPGPDYNGPDSFTFTVTDDATAGGPAKTSPAATVTLTVTPVNGTPTATPQSASMIEGTAKLITLSGTDGDQEVVQALTYAILNGPTHGTLGTLNTATGEVTYTPNSGYSGPDSFTFTVTDDGTAGGLAKTSPAASVTLTVAPRPTVSLSLDATSIAEASGSTLVTATLSQVTDVPVTVTLGFSGSATESVDYSHSATQIVIAAGSTTGSITLTAIQDSLFEGDQAAVIDISSVTNAAENGTQQATLQILDDDHAPVFTSSATPSVPENTITILQLSATDADLPAQTLTMAITGGADQARFSLVGNTLSFTTAPNFESPTDANANNVYEVQITVSDGQGGTTVQNLSVTITDVLETVPPALNSPSVLVISNKAHRIVQVLPQIEVTGTNLGGGTLKISLNSPGTKKPADTLSFAATLGAIPVPTKSGSYVWQFQLSPNVTAASIQSFLRSITFSTKGAGLKQTTRSLQVTLTNAQNQSANFNQGITVAKK